MSLKPDQLLSIFDDIDDNKSFWTSWMSSPSGDLNRLSLSLHIAIWSIQYSLIRLQAALAHYEYYRPATKFIRLHLRHISDCSNIFIHVILNFLVSWRDWTNLRLRPVCLVWTSGKFYYTFENFARTRNSSNILYGTLTSVVVVLTCALGYRSLVSRIKLVSHSDH